MKKLLLFLIAAVLILPGMVLAQNQTLSSAEINRISNSVVLVLSIDSTGQPTVSGSGTIISPTGLIYTNRHVVENGSDFAILTLSDVGEAANLAYYASPAMIHPDVDFAELQIDRDAHKNPLDASTLNLPTIPLATTLPSIGDRIFVFGYPTLGDAHIVFTSGSITTIENDTLNGQRIPYWYETDAQISPGNSGGLVVNSDGEMIGIPTLVRSEDRTLGRLGAILSISAIRGALASQQGSAGPVLVPTQAGVATQSAPPSNNGSNAKQKLSIDITNVEHNITYNDALGVKIHTHVNAVGYNGVALRAAVFGFWQDGSPMLANNRSPSDARSTTGQMSVQQVVTPGFDNTVYDDMWFFLPYDDYPEGRTGTFPAYFEAEVGIDGQGFSTSSHDEAFNYTYPDQQLIVDITSIEHDVQVNNTNGMKVHTHVNTIGYQGQTVRVALFVYWKDGTPIINPSAPADNRTSTDALTVQSTLVPSYDNSEWSDYWFFMPYSYFPTGLHGAQDAYAEIEIGLDGQGFASWSLDDDFVLTYAN